LKTTNEEITSETAKEELTPDTLIFTLSVQMLNNMHLKMRVHARFSFTQYGIFDFRHGNQWHDSISYQTKRVPFYAMLNFVLVA
jgi:hypothetical protein